MLLQFFFFFFGDRFVEELLNFFLCFQGRDFLIRIILSPNPNPQGLLNGELSRVPLKTESEDVVKESSNTAR